MFQTHPLLQAKNWKQLWKIKANARLKNLLWKISWNILPTCTVFNNRFPLPLLDCYLCNNAPKYLEHLFLQCDCVAQIWLMAPWPINLSSLSNISILDQVKIILNPKKNLGLDDESAQEFQLYSLLICDQLWFFRNKARVEGSKSNPIELARQIRSVFEEHKQAWSKLPRRPPKINTWQPPPNSQIKLNFDAAIREEKISVVVVGRDDLGKLLLAWAKQLDPRDSLIGEAKVAWCAIKCVAMEGYRNIILEVTL